MLCWRQIESVVSVSFLFVLAGSLAMAQVPPEADTAGKTVTIDHVHGQGHGHEDVGHGHEEVARGHPIRMSDIRFIRAFSFDPTKGEFASIRYTLPQPALVRIRVRHRGTRELFLATVLNLEPRAAGPHEEHWNGIDYWGVPVRFEKRPFEYLMEAESPGTRESAEESFSGVQYREGETQQEVIDKIGFKRHVHALHNPDYENVPLLHITDPAPGSELKGRHTIRSHVDEERRGYGDKYGYGIRYYLDDQLVHEEFYTPESDGSFSYTMDTTPFDDGEHILYIGLCDHNDHVTSRGVAISIQNLDHQE